MITEIILLECNPESFCSKVLLILLDKFFLAAIALCAGYYVTKIIEENKSNQSFINEIGKEKVKKISDCWDALSEFEREME